MLWAQESTRARRTHHRVLIRMTTEISKTPKNKSVFQNFPDYLKIIWKEDNTRHWGVYFKEQQFSYFWDNRDVVDQKKMTPEEFDFLKKLSEDVLELKAMLKRFTTEKKQYWKDEMAARRRERGY